MAFIIFHLSFAMFLISEQNSNLTLCMLGNFACFFVVCRLFTKMNFFKKIFQKYHQSVMQFGSGSGPTFCWA